MMYCYWLIIAQIVLESFPISSSAHTILLQRILQQIGGAESFGAGFYACFPTFSFVISDLVAHWMHGPTVLVVAVFFFNQWFFLLKHIRQCWRIIMKIIAYAALADLITALFFLLFRVIGTAWFPLPLGLCITFFCLYSVMYIKPSTHTTRLNARTAFLLGVVQGCALLPGISRLGSTYVAARWLGFSVDKAFTVSLLIQWPLLLAAWTHSFYVFTDCGVLSEFLTPTLLIVMIISMVCAFYALKFTYYCFMTHRERWFAWYLIIPIGLWIWLSATAYTF